MFVECLGFFFLISHMQAGGPKVMVRSSEAQLVVRAGAAAQLPHVQQTGLRSLGSPVIMKGPACEGKLESQR